MSISTEALSGASRLPEAQSPSPLRRGPQWAYSAPYALAYDRVSQFRVTQQDLGLDQYVSRGTSRQWEDALATAAKHQLGPMGPSQRFTDEGISASKYSRKKREAWPALLQEIQTGRPTHLLIWLLDRIIRDTGDLDRLLDLCRIHGVLIVQTGTGTVIDPDNPDSVMQAKLLGVFAEYEVAKMSMRATRQMAAAGEAGAVHGGLRRFGYEPGMKAHREAEAAVVREAAAKVIAGSTLRALAKDLADRGITGTGGGAITGTNLGKILRHPYLAGYRQHKGDLYEASWEPILTRAVWEQLQAVLANPARRTSFSNTRKHLLSGIATCAVCEGKVRGRPKYVEGGANVPIYICGPSQGHVGKPISVVDQIVVKRVVARLKEPDLAAALVPSASEEEVAALHQQITDLGNRLTELDQDFAKGEISKRTLNGRTAAVEADLLTAETALQDLLAQQVEGGDLLEGMTGPLAQEAWDALSEDMGRQRAIINLVARVVLLPAPYKGAPFTPDQVKVTLRESPH